MNDYSTHWLTPCFFRASSDVELLYKNASFGERNTKQKAARIEEEANALKANNSLANRFLTSVYYLSYLSENVSRKGSVFPWNEPLWSSQMISKILGIGFVPLDFDIPFLAKDYNEIVRFPEPEDLPELIILVHENSINEVIKLTADFKKTMASFISLDDTDIQRFYVRIIPMNEVSLALLTCFPRNYKKSILKRITNYDLKSIPIDIAYLFPFVVSRVKLNIGVEPSINFCVDSLYKDLDIEYGDVSKSFAFMFVNLIYNLCLSYSLEKAINNEDCFMRLNPKNTLLGYNYLCRYNSLHETIVSTQSLLFDFENYSSKSAHERSLILDRSFYTYLDNNWYVLEAKKEITKTIRKIRNEWPNYDFPSCVAYLLKDKENEAADIVCSWIGSRYAVHSGNNKIREFVMEAASVLYRRYLLSVEPMVFSDESLEKGIPYDEINYSGDDYITHSALIPNDEEYRCFDRARWVVVFASQDMICSKICNFVSISSASESQKKRTFQIVCRRGYPDFESAVSDLGVEALGFDGANIREVVGKIIIANERHRIIDEGEGVIALKIMPITIQS